MSPESSSLKKEALVILKAVGLLLVLPSFLLTTALAIFLPIEWEGKYTSAFVSLILFVVLLALFSDDLGALLLGLFRKQR
ncbi:hypothetical protein HPY42_05880 [Coprothermobacteraceae bacterium]|nr:hypothetical protein [Coprothermobacteraceae bacterium]